ncbi:MAG: hypothetical protein V4450_05355 [Bacteroidota bacterium]
MAENPTTDGLNCGTYFHGNYCFECGQKASVSKLNWTSLLDEFIHFLHMSNIVWLAITKLLTGLLKYIVEHWDRYCMRPILYSIFCTGSFPLNANKKGSRSIFETLFYI